MGLRVKALPKDSLAVRLREAREAADMSQKDVADFFAVSTRTVQYWEAGQVPTPKHRRRVRFFIERHLDEAAA